MYQNTVYIIFNLTHYRTSFLFSSSIILHFVLLYNSCSSITFLNLMDMLI